MNVRLISLHPHLHRPAQSLSIVVITLCLLLSGCNSTAVTRTSQATISDATLSNTALVERLDPQCQSQVVQRNNTIGDTGDAAQQIALANAATRCIENKTFYPQHPDNQMAMQLSALAIVNFIKAGETQLAKQSFQAFRTQFPQQDLLFDDYTSFVDTAVALLEQEQLSARQLQVLNINPSLRAELKRQQYWLRN